MPGVHTRHRLDVDMKQRRSRGEHAALDLGVGEVGSHALRVEAELGAPVLLLPVARIRGGDLLDRRLALLGERQQRRILARTRLARGRIDLAEVLGQLRGRADHLIRHREVCPGRIASRRASCSRRASSPRRVSVFAG